MKIMATWFRERRGLALGVLVGALTLGKASPYLVNALGSANWRHNVLFVSLLALVGGLVVLLFVEDGPYALSGAGFAWKQVARVFSNHGVRLANFWLFRPHVGTVRHVDLDSSHDSRQRRTAWR
jgi:hypothetical protein